MPFNALLDACVLYPVYVRDTLLSIAETGLYRVLWSEEILDETRRNILDDNPHLRGTDQLDKTFAAMRRAFPDAIVTGHDAIIEQMTNNPKDRHVLAAAVVGGAQVLVTNNIRDFPAASVAPYHVDVQTPDEFLRYGLDLNPEACIRAIGKMSTKRVHPPVSIAELLTDLARAGLNTFTTDLRDQLARTDPTEPWLQALDLTDLNIGGALSQGRQTPSRQTPRTERSN